MVRYLKNSIARREPILGMIMLVLGWMSGIIMAGCTVGIIQAGAENPLTASPSPTLTLTKTFTINATSLDQTAWHLTGTPPVVEVDELLTTEEPVSTQTLVPTPTATYDPATWGSLPVLPELSPHAQAILAEGIRLGNNPRAFSKIGDCESRTTWFLGDFDLDPQYYSLGPYEVELSPVIEHYQGSFNRLSQAAKPGFTAASLLSPIWADREACEKGESPLECEYRQHRPVMAFIMIGTNDAVNPKTFEGHMRRVIETSLAHRVLPVLGTKADNVEGDHAINATLARLAHEYDVPLWNYWLAVQELPGNGLQEDGAHLTFGTPHFNNPAALKKAWPVRNLNALQILHQIMNETN